MDLIRAHCITVSPVFVCDGAKLKLNRWGSASNKLTQWTEKMRRFSEPTPARTSQTSGSNASVTLDTEQHQTMITCQYSNDDTCNTAYYNACNVTFSTTVIALITGLIQGLKLKTLNSWSVSIITHRAWTITESKKAWHQWKLVG